MLTTLLDLVPDMTRGVFPALVPNIADRPVLLQAWVMIREYVPVGEPRPHDPGVRHPVLVQDDILTIPVGALRLSEILPLNQHLLHLETE